MRLVTWNCKGAFARKHGAIAALRPDVLVVPESEKIDDVQNVAGSAPVRSVAWVGSNPKKGLAVLSYGDYSLQVHEAWDPRHQWVLPVTVSGPVPFTLFAVWAMPHPQSRLYVQCLFEAFEDYREILASPRVVWAGDFNNNVVLDGRAHRLKFSNLVDRLGDAGLQSLYHLHHEYRHGAEEHMTFFLHHKAEKGFHIDFIFAKPALYSGGFEISVGEHAAWFKASDHMPVTCSFGVDEKD